MRERNHWVVHPNALVQWGAWVPVRPDAPGDLLAWTADVIALAEDTGIAEFRRPDGAWWTRRDLVAELERRYASDGIVDAFGFSSGASRTRSRIAYCSDAGVVEEPIDDAGALLQRLRGPIPDEKQHAVESAEPLWVFGHAIDYKAGATNLAAASLPTTSVELGFRADLWLPWVPGKLEAEPQDELYDNRALASRHTTRLNGFLAEVRRITVARGGSWHFTSFTSAPWLEAQATADGIAVLDRPPPRGRYVPPR